MSQEKYDAFRARLAELPPNTTEIAIVELIRVEDTREWFEGPDDRWHAIPGSGDSRECDSCGREHEVHAHVLLSDGTEAVVGTGCARGTEFEKALRTGASQAKTTARLAAQLTAARAKLIRAREITAEVAALELPSIAADRSESGTLIFRMGTVTVWQPRDEGEITADRRDCLASSWRASECRERGLTLPIHHAASEVSDLERRIAKREGGAS